MIRTSIVVVVAGAAIAAARVSFADSPITNFTPGDLVVLRGGDSTVANTTAGGGAPTNGFNGTVKAYLDEYTPNGTYVGTVSVPGLTLNGAGGSSHEGGLNLSVDGHWLTFSGYDPAVRRRHYAARTGRHRKRNYRRGLR